MTQEPMIPYQEFSWDVFNDFLTYFKPNENLPVLLRDKEEYQGLTRENPDLEGRLRNTIGNLKDINPNTVNPYRGDIHRAYRIMRKYVKSDVDLGINPI